MNSSFSPRGRLQWVTGCFCLVLWCVVASAGPVVLFDFRGDAEGWVARHAVDRLRATPEGLSFACTGEDPYLAGPENPAMPVGTGMLLTLRMKSTGDGSGEVFYGRVFQAGQSARFRVTPDGEWHDYEVALPPQEPGSRLRIDPSSGPGEVTIAWIKVTPFDDFLNLAFPVPLKRKAVASPRRVTAGEVTVAHGGRHWNDFVVHVAGREMAAAHGQARIGVPSGDGVDYFDLAEAPLRVEDRGDGSLHTSVEVIDRDGARWFLERDFVPLRELHAVTFTTSLRVDRDREVCHLPMVTLFPGHGRYGERKSQAVLPGVEYLADEPSSSEADVRGAKANRRLVDDCRLTSPMMAVAAEGRYIGLAWNRRHHPAPVFDSPDRVFLSGAHLMGLWYPGVGPHRLEGSLDVMRPLVVRPEAPVTLAATVFGGRGTTINPAVEHALRLSGGPPPVPAFEGGLAAAIDLLARGWLDSELNVDWRWRHAVWHDRFDPAPVADAPGYMLWLAEYTKDPALARRLREGARKGLEQLDPSDRYEAHCAHVARPFAPLLFGSIDAYAARRAEHARRSLGRFDEDGRIRYRPKPGGPDYARTHWADHANGLSATPLEGILEAAAFSGDAELGRRAIDLVDRQLAAYADTVPRGAQTWEMPLHTPDILAAARLLRCCTLAYQFTGDARYIEAGRSWAWTGVSLLYLDPPTSGPVGTYATTAVLGATNWDSPYWIGLPVQWCGLVYRSALRDFSGLDPEQGSFWAHLADGITRCGLQQTFPAGDAARQGLLPDYFHLEEQAPDGPAISPGTVQAHLAEAYGAVPIYSLRRVTRDGLLLHVPGDIGDPRESGASVEVSVVGWRREPYWIRLVRVGADAPQVTLRGGRILTTEHDPVRGTLNLLIEGSGTLKLTR